MNIKIAENLVKTPSGKLLPSKINDEKLWNLAMYDLAKNNTFFPDIKRIVFSVKTECVKTDKFGKKTKAKLDSPILATTVEFIDNTKVTVKNSGNDKVTLVTDPETGVVTASPESKELGVVYAVLKRCHGTVDSKGMVNGNGFGNALRSLVSKAFDQNVEAKRSEMKAAAARKKLAEQQKTSAEKQKSNPHRGRYSVADLSELFDRLAERVASDIELKWKMKEEGKAKTPPKAKKALKSPRKSSR